MRKKVAKVKEESQDAFHQMISPLINDMYKLAYSYLKNEEDAKDILQDAAIDIYISMKKLKKEESLKQWVEQIVVNKCKKYFNRK